MKRLFIEDISPGDEVVDFFLVRSKNLSTTRAGKPYLDLELQDRTGLVSAKVWDRAEDFDPLFKRGDLIKIKATAESYREQTQLKVAQIRVPTDKETLDQGDFLPATKKNVDDMWDELEEIIEGVEHPFLSQLLVEFFGDEQFLEMFRRSVAARNIHHAYLGGLLEHTLQVVKLAVTCTEMYPELDRDLLVTTAILHDIGKVRELETVAEIIYSTEGYLIGHISLGMQMLEDKIRTIEGFPHELGLRCKHILISHHGELEWGSPVVPKMAEAIVLHYLDNLDAKTKQVFQAIEKDKNVGEAFTEYNRVMGRNFYKGPRDEE